MRTKEARRKYEECSTRHFEERKVANGGINEHIVLGGGNPTATREWQKEANGVAGHPVAVHVLGRKLDNLRFLKVDLTGSHDVIVSKE